MSATPNNAGPWPGAPSDPEHATVDVLSGSAEGRDALQALLAFASIQQHASQRYSGFAKQSQQHDLALDEVLGLVAARAVSITGADGVAIALATDTAIVCRAAAGRIAPDRGIRLDPNSGFSGACLRSGQSVKCDDSESDPRVNAGACRRLGARSMIAVPLSAKERVIGLIEAFSSDAYGFNDTDVNSLNLLAELILAAIRPEEEDRMAELSRHIVMPEPSSANDDMTSGVVLAGSGEAPAQEPVDEEASPPGMPEETAGIEASHFSTPLPEISQAEAIGEEASHSAAPSLETQVIRERSFLGIAVVAGLVIVAVGLGVLVTAKIRHTEQFISASTRSGESAQSAQGPGPSLPSAPIKPGATPQVTGIRHWSSANSSTVVLDLEDQVQYESHSLEDPPRIYFDLHDTKLGPAVVNASINIDDSFLKRVRAAETSAGIARVVLETKGNLEFSVRLDPNPYRLTIEVRKPTSASPATSSPGTLSKPSPAIDSRSRTSAGSVDPSDLKIVLDPGHGGWDLGTVGRKGLLEKDLVLDIVARLGKLITEKLNSQVIYTRQDDSYLPLEKRAEIANLAQANLFLSVHANYSDLPTARGIETYYTNTYSSVKARTDDDNPILQQVNWTGVDIRAKVVDSRRLATDIQQALFSGLVSRNSEIRDRGVKKAEYVVLTGTQMPAVLTEVSFVSSPADEDKLQNSEYRQQIAEAIYRGLVKYYREIKHTKVAKALN